MDISFLDQKTIFTIIHILGVAIGAGGAYVSDMIFMSSIRDQKISKTEMRFLTLGSIFVWAGLVTLIASGIGILLTDTEGYLSSSKFLAKMSIVFIIFLNGILFHVWHLPRIKRHVDSYFPSSEEFMSKKPFLFASGAISFTSWTFALTLGAIRYVPYSYNQIMLTYLLVLLVGIISSQLIFRNK